MMFMLMTISSLKPAVERKAWAVLQKTTIDGMTNRQCKSSCWVIKQAIQKTQTHNNKIGFYNNDKNNKVKYPQPNCNKAMLQIDNKSHMLILIQTTHGSKLKFVFSADFCKKNKKNCLNHFISNTNNTCVYILSFQCYHHHCSVI